MAFVICVAPLSASANDSSSAIGAGGLEQIKSSSIRMVSEDLHISRRQIRVRYLFRNLSDQEQKVTVAFPLDFEAGFYGGDRLPERGDDNALIETISREMNFTITVDGKPVQVESRHMQMVDRKGRDVTERLVGLGVANTLTSLFLVQGRGLPKLEPAQEALLIRDGLLKREQGSLRPQWRTRLSLVWSQTYAPRQDVVVEHSYKPFQGSFFLYKDRYRQTLDRYCASPAIRNEARRRKYYPFQGMNLSYILTTANSWAGPIEDFRLTVEKSDSWEILTQCGARLKRINPTTFAMRAKNFVPQRDLDILILGR